MRNYIKEGAGFEAVSGNVSMHYIDYCVPNSAIYAINTDLFLQHVWNGSSFFLAISLSLGVLVPFLPRNLSVGFSARNEKRRATQQCAMEELSSPKPKQQEAPYPSWETCFLLPPSRRLSPSPALTISTLVPFLSPSLSSSKSFAPTTSILQRKSISSSGAGLVSDPVTSTPPAPTPTSSALPAALTTSTRSPACCFP